METSIYSGIELSSSLRVNHFILFPVGIWSSKIQDWHFEYATFPDLGCSTYSYVEFYFSKFSSQPHRLNIRLQRQGAKQEYTVVKADPVILSK